MDGNTSLQNESHLHAKSLGNACTHVRVHVHVHTHVAVVIHICWAHIGTALNQDTY